MMKNNTLNLEKVCEEADPIVVGKDGVIYGYCMNRPIYKDGIAYCGKYNVKCVPFGIGSACDLRNYKHK